MKKYIYLGLAVVGIVLPMSQFIPASMAGEFSVSGMFAEMTATRTITGVTFDFLVATLTALVFGIYEAVRLKLRLAWIPLLGTFLIGVSFGLPFFLYLRELEMERGTSPG
jgi:hypothetical protein